MKTILILTVFLTTFLSKAQTALGHINITKQNSYTGEKTELSIFKSYDKEKVILLKIESGNKDLKIEIPIKHYNEIWEKLININASDIARRNVYCDDSVKMKISFGISNEVSYDINCISDKKTDENLYEILKLVIDLEKKYCH